MVIAGMSTQGDPISRPRTLACLGVLVVAAMAAFTSLSGAAGSPTYILNGYAFRDMKTINTAELEAKLNQKAGARVTDADVETDRAIIQKEIEARHLKGQVYVIVAEKKGRAWFIFDLLDLSGPPKGAPVYHLESESFEGASRVSTRVLAAATGLHQGEALTNDKIKDARAAIFAAYAKALPGGKLTLKLKLQFRANGKARMTWIIGEPKPGPPISPGRSKKNHTR